MSKGDFENKAKIGSGPYIAPKNENLLKTLLHLVFRFLPDTREKSKSSNFVFKYM